MKPIFKNLSDNDNQTKIKFNLNHGILMEHAASGMLYAIRKFLDQFTDATIQIVCGSGDNGGDGYALARLLYDYCNILVVSVKPPKSELCKLQAERLGLLGISVEKKIKMQCDILVDCFLGTGLNGELNQQAINLVETLNNVNAKYRFACDIPSGLSSNGIPSPVAFKSDITFSMGAIKMAFYSDFAKDIVGNVEVLPLGLPSCKYELPTDMFLLEKVDMCLPIRNIQNSNKGSFGHVVIYCGEHDGACSLAGTAALKFGVGKITLIGKQSNRVPSDFMYSNNICFDYSAMLLGSGAGNYVDDIISLLKAECSYDKNVVFDADILYSRDLISVLHKFNKAILTPHPKEFLALLKNAQLGDFSVNEIQMDRFDLAKKFTNLFPNIVLVLKGANTLIATADIIYVNASGSNKLAKAGSGDVLAGMIVSLLAQGYSPLKACISASLAHAFAGEYCKSSYSLTSTDLIENLSKLEKE